MNTLHLRVAVVMRASAEHSDENRDHVYWWLQFKSHCYHPAPFVAVFTRQRNMSAQM